MKKIISIILLSLSFFSCVKENKGDVSTVTDDFNRELILSNWVQNLIIPAYADFKTKVEDLQNTAIAFVNNPNVTTQATLQNALFEAQKKWQHVAMFELQGTTRIYMNTYPVDRETSVFPDNNSNEDNATLEENLSKSVTEINQINFENSSGTIDEQGFAALDFLINKENALSKFTELNTAESYKAYLNKVVDRVVVLTNTAHSYWVNNANSIIANSGSSASASFDKMANDYINYVEQGFRENKIAIPSGKRNNIKKVQAVESYYSSEHSKELFEEAYKAVKNFYYGTSYDGNQTAEGIKDYLDYLSAEVYISNENRYVPITTFIEAKFKDIDTAVNDLDADFVTYLNSLPEMTPATKMHHAFNEIQEYVILIKVNAFQALNIRIDYVDSDGD